MSPTELYNEYKHLTYNEKISFWANTIAPGTFNSDNVDTKLEFISLVCVLVIAYRKKKPEITCREILYKVLGPQASGFDKEILENISVLCENFVYNCKQANKCGLSTAPEVVDRIKQIYDSWMPF